MARCKGVATALANTSAFAPVYFAVTVTEGGTISGNCVIGSVFNDISPSRVMNTEITVERIGLLINSSNMIIIGLDYKVEDNRDSYACWSVIVFGLTLWPSFTSCIPS